MQSLQNMTLGALLSTTNLELSAAQWIIPAATNAKQTTMSQFPFGTVAGDGTGEIALKVLLVGSSASVATRVEGLQVDKVGITSTQTLPIGGQTHPFNTWTPGYVEGQAAMVTLDTVTGAMLVQPPKGPVTTAQTNPASSATTVTLLASNTQRKGAIIKNNASTVLHVCLAGTATVAASSYDLPAYSATIGVSLEIPFGYAGAISGIWEGAPTGNSNVTEITQ